MKVTFRGPENQIETAGYGILKQGVPTNIPNLQYAYDLCATRRCDPADESARSTYEKMRLEAIESAAAACAKVDELKAGGAEKIPAELQRAAVITCDQCLSEVHAVTLKNSGCPHCQKSEEKEK